MRRVFTAFAIVLAGCVVRVPPPVVAPPPVVTVSIDTFGPHLDPYGEWMVVPGYGRVWQPSVRHVGLDFFPYGTGGHWVYTNAGWVFDNDYPFGWAVFHYGRWFRHVDHGWMWVPGNTWAPAWVSWRTGGTYIGWAPLGPAGEPGFHHRHWCFVDNHHFRERNVRVHAVGEHEFHGAVALTAPHAAVGPPPSFVSRTPIVPLPVSDVRGSGRVVPPPPPPGRSTAALPPPPPPAARVEPERVAPPAPGRYEPSPPPARFEPPPPARYQPTPQPPARYQPPPPARFERTPVPPPARVEPERLRMPPPAYGAPQPPPPAQSKKKVEVPPPQPPGKQRLIVPPPQRK